MTRARTESEAPLKRTWLGTDTKVVRHVHVFGSGYLAAATRLELSRLGIHRETDYHLPPLLPPLVIACSDSESDSSFRDSAQRLMEERSPLLFASLVGRLVRIGPLIEPRALCIARRRGGDAAPDSSYGAACAESPGTEPQGSLACVAEPDPSLGLQARLGALLIAAQALNFLLGARNQCVLDRVIELNAFTAESKTYRVIKVRQ